MPEYPVINALNVEKDAIIVEKKVLEALVAQYGTPHFIQKKQRDKTLHFTFLNHKTIIAYEESTDEKAPPKKKQADHQRSQSR
ncbi:hypothetical protein ANME2D_01754 [Candidatus Methanoperedens nitroreducens]|uniref:Uncharacterized protein n=1 Tax=Candidatus Methanoperedens nitratireducens TaxID=1392998 RepID=A0A062V6Z8_9EURY|nr:hypothetical protein [Candidatus Methanoperedens nitroreducens]KCZ72348.1 hypothetical protein ANME2D_01754 [Candidatus Methanoperedens nitroreducens]MDJ1423718.1 hypothetical protein [Candidatus Methanoperedens sp.]